MGTHMLEIELSDLDERSDIVIRIRPFSGEDEDKAESYKKGEGYSL
ncbi:MAG TPA: hypothetical protein GX506_01490 [Firmicutes bacterium]|nr:hypothetical protein [Bacillota bacterium]